MNHCDGKSDSVPDLSEEDYAGRTRSRAQTFQQLLPEIRIDTSRLDQLLSSFQCRLGTLETAFGRIVEAAAEAAHKVWSKRVIALPGMPSGNTPHS